MGSHPRVCRQRLRAARARSAPSQSRSIEAWQWIALLESDLKFHRELPTRSCGLQHGRIQIGMNDSHLLKLLPPDYNTINKIAQLDEITFKRLVNDGTICPIAAAQRSLQDLAASARRRRRAARSQSGARRRQIPHHRFRSGLGLRLALDSRPGPSPAMRCRPSRACASSTCGVGRSRSRLPSLLLDHEQFQQRGAQAGRALGLPAPHAS